jgi:predicted nucleic acid-binding protein
VSGPVFIDSGAFIAFLDRSDDLHKQALSLFARRPRRWLTSVFVIAETYGWFLNRLGEDAARAFRLLITDLPALHVLGTETKHLAAVHEKLERLRGTKLTWVDASSLVCLEQKSISTVWGTDHHLAIEGAKVIPGPTATGRSSG